jgi:hypothetical protein
MVDKVEEVRISSIFEVFCRLKCVSVFMMYMLCKNLALYLKQQIKVIS